MPVLAPMSRSIPASISTHALLFATWLSLISPAAGAVDPERDVERHGPFQLEVEGELPVAPPLADRFSLRLAVEDAEPGRLIEIPGCLRLDLMPDRRLRLSADATDGERRLRWSAEALPEHGKSWIALAVDRERFGHISLVGAGSPVALLGYAPASATFDRILVGGAKGRLTALEVHRRWLTSESLLELATEPEADGPPPAEVGGAAGWRGVERTHLAVEGDELVWAPAQWRRDPLPPGPISRTAHPTAMFPDGRVVMFSGEVRDTHVHPMRTLADTWIYEPDGTAPGVGRWREVEGPAPRGRSHQAMAPLPWAGVALLVAGWDNGAADGPPETLGDSWVFGLETGRWAELPAPLKVEVRMSDTPICWVPSLEACVLFGTDRPYALERASGAWRPLPPYTKPGTTEPADWPGRSSGFAADPKSGRVVLVGGQRWEGGDLETRRMLDETRIWDPRDGSLETVEVEPRPPAMTRPLIGFDPELERVLMFGGSVTQAERLDELWSFDLDERRWRQHRQADCPGPRGGFMSPLFDEQRGELVMIHGRSGLGRFHQDVWRLRFDREARAHAVVELAFGAAEAAEATDLSALVELSGAVDAAVTLSARPSERGVLVELAADGVSEDDPLRVHRIALVRADVDPAPTAPDRRISTARVQ